MVWFLEEGGKQPVCFVFSFFYLGMSLLSGCPALLPHPLMGHIWVFHLFCVLFFNWWHLFSLCHVQYLCVIFAWFFWVHLFKPIWTLLETNNKKWHCFYPVNLLALTPPINWGRSWRIGEFKQMKANIIGVPINLRSTCIGEVDWFLPSNSNIIMGNGNPLAPLIWFHKIPNFETKL